MSFPDHIDRILNAYGVTPDTKAALYDLYLSLGDEVLDVFADMAERVASPSMMQPEDTTTIRSVVVERYLTRNHPQWLAGRPTPSLWHPRQAEGRASGLAMPLGEMTDEVRRVVAVDQPVADGIVMLGRNAHFGGRSETISFDIVARELDEAIAIGAAEGRQHTIPGSVGATSGTFDSIRNAALIWEVQPNVYKPREERNRAIARVHRRHRNWHLLTLASALTWLRQQGCTTFVLRGDALTTTHEEDPAHPLSPEIAAHHDRTVQEVARALGMTLKAPTQDDERLLAESSLMNHALRRHVMEQGAAGAVWRAGT